MKSGRQKDSLISSVNILEALMFHVASSFSHA